MSTHATKIGIITGEPSWDELDERWEQLMNVAPGAAAFQGFPFLRCWWRHFGGGKAPFVVTAIKGDRLVGAIPLQLVRRRLLGRKYRVLEFIGMPDELDRPRAIIAGDDIETLRSLLGAVAARRSDWDILHLDELEDACWQIDCIEGWADDNGFKRHRMPLHSVPYLEKKGDWEAFLGAKSGHFRKRLRAARRRAARDWDVRYEAGHGGPAMARFVDLFLEVERKSWKFDERVDVGSVDGYRAFYEDLLGNDADELRGHALVQYFDDTPSAVTLGFSSREIYYSLQIAHDARFDRYSPGTLLEAREMEWFFAETSLQRFDFLGGGNANKRRWTHTATETSSLIIRRPGLHMAMADLLRHRLAARLPGGADRPESG